MTKRNRRRRNSSADRATGSTPERVSDHQPEARSIEDVESAEGMGEPAYVQERTLLVEMEQKSADQHDKAILTIASGGLALSITFLKDIAPNPLSETWKYLGVSWACFVLGILAVLLSFLTSQSACRKQRDFLDKLYQDGSASVADKKNWWSSWTHWLNWVSYALVFFAVVFFTFFSWLNLGKGGHETMTDKPQNQQVQVRTEPIEVKLGNVPPKLPVSPTMERKPGPTGNDGKDNKK
jgi:magnesium-transporting ATPase (P-type)